MPPTRTRPRPRATKRTFAARVALVGLLAACAPADRADPGGWAGSVDTLPDGRVLVRNASAPRVAWTLKERFRIGSLDEPGPALFGQIAGLHLDAEGGVQVLDGQASEVRAFGPDGTFLRAYGGEGQGPGELRRGAGLAAAADGTLWVMNWGNARYTGFDPQSGAVRREARRVLSFASFPWPGGFEGRRRLLDIGLDASGQPAILRLDTLFVPTDTLPLPQPADGDRVVWRRGALTVASLVEPFAPQPAWAPRPAGGIVLGEGGTYRLHRIAFGGDTTLTIEVAREPVRVTSAERDSAMAVLGEMAAMLGGAVADRSPTPGASSRPTAPSSWTTRIASGCGPSSPTGRAPCGTCLTPRAASRGRCASPSPRASSAPTCAPAASPWPPRSGGSPRWWSTSWSGWKG